MLRGEPELIPYEIGRVFALAASKAYMFKVVFQPEALNAKGVLASCLKCFEENGVPILMLHTSWYEAAGKLWAFIVADVPEASAARRVAECLRGVEMVRSVEFAPPIVDGVSADPWSFPPLLGGQRVVLMREVILGSFLRAGWSKLGSGFGSILYHTFFEAGVEAYRGYSSMLSGGRKEIMEFASRAFAVMGYGVLRIQEWTDTRFVARVYDSVECRNLPSDVGEAESMLVRALLAGFAAASWGVDARGVLPRETKCIRRGDPYCEFAIEKRASSSQQ